MRHVVVAVIFALGFAPVAYAADDEATSIMRRSEKAHRIPFEATVSRMVLQEKGGQPRSRMMKTLTDQSTNDADKGRVQFTEPAEVKNLGLLTLEADGADGDQQWLFLPAFRKTRRIAQSDLGDRFAESDIFYEDMKRRRIDDYTFTMLPSEKVDGAECYVIESKPKAPKVIESSPYGRTLLSIRKDTLLIVAAKYFDKKDKPLKRFETSKLVQVSKTAWRANETVMTDLQRQHRTTISVVSREMLSAPPPEEFTRARLETE
jgi:hypothetical protein